MRTAPSPQAKGTLFPQRALVSSNKKSTKPPNFRTPYLPIKTGAGWSSGQKPVAYKIREAPKVRPPSREKSPTKVTGNDLRLAGRPESAHMQEIPLLVTKEEFGKRRVFSAKKGREKVKIVERKEKSKTWNFHSTLDPQFLDLFD